MTPITEHANRQVGWLGSQWRPVAKQDIRGYWVYKDDFDMRGVVYARDILGVITTAQSKQPDGTYLLLARRVAPPRVRLV